VYLQAWHHVRPEVLVRPCTCRPCSCSSRMELPLARLCDHGEACVGLGKARLEDAQLVLEVGILQARLAQLVQRLDRTRFSSRMSAGAQGDQGIYRRPTV